MTQQNLHMAAKFTATAKAIPDYPCLIQGQQRLSWRQVDERNNRMANALLEAAALQRGDRVAVMERNSPAYIESYLAAMKLALVPCNVNYKYRSEELLYLLEDSGAAVLVINEDFLPTFEPIAAQCPRLKLVVVIGPSAQAALPTGRRAYAACLAHGAATPPKLSWAAPNNDDLLFLLYTGGTTGFPKGVMWDTTVYREMHRLLGPMVRGIIDRLPRAPASMFRSRTGHENAISRFMQSPVFRWLIAREPVREALGRYAERSFRERASGPLDVAARKARAMRRFPNPTLVACPLMHGTGWLTAMNTLTAGDAVIFLEGTRFDAAEVWRTVEREKVCTIIIVGDAFAVPLLEELERHPYDTASMLMMNSSGVVWSPKVKQGLLKKIPQLIIVDSLGASDGLGRSEPITAQEGEIKPMRFRLSSHMKVFDDQDREVVPGSGITGQLAICGLIPRGYWRDEAKTAKIFRTINGVRYSIFGDVCTVEADGSLTLLGRGSGVINTGGEKVFPEEVENVIHDQPGVADCVVVGAPDARYGQVIAALIEFHPGRSGSLDDIAHQCSARLANYKKPRHLFVVDKIPRKDNGKMEYARAREIVAERIQQLTPSA
ncbi:AMP-binding protein [Panacagrimonas sp.]|uniref:AMP-binding protein n=1 Tax=Panacagrimonas sp. TaxID=2480088 RepID=UPI003B521335